MATSDLKQQQQRSFNNNKLKLFVHSYDYKEYHHKFTLLSTDDNRLRSITHPLLHYPFASSNAELLLCYCSIGGPALWNPGTDDLKILPKSSVPRPPLVTSERDMYYGFGFDPNSLQEEQLDYKVVRFLSFMLEYRSMDEFKVELYSLKTDSWKNIAIPPNILDMPSGLECVHINGFHYWVASNNINRGFCIIRFDFANDEFSSSNIPLPETDKINYDDEDLRYNFIITEFEGSLAVVAYSLADVLGTDDEKPYEFEIWAWNDDDESWTRKRVCQIVVPDGSAGVGRPLGLFKNDKLYLKDIMCGIVVFDCGNGRLTYTGSRFDEYGTAKIFPYVESSAEDIKFRELLSNSTKLTPVIRSTTNSKQKHNNKLKHLMDHKYEGTPYFSQLTKDDNDGDDKNVFFNFPSLGQRFYPAASCNNALLLCYVGMDKAALWNPTTDHVKKLPDLVSHSQRYHISCYGLGFDPKQAAASQDYDYKVIRFIMNHGWKHPLKVELYSLKTDSFKDITSLYPLSKSPKSQAIYIDGFSYWVVPEPADIIISFDFAKEEFSSAPHIPLPPPFHEKLAAFNARLQIFLAEFHGSLAALVYTEPPIARKREKPFQLEIWVWNSDESSSSWARVSGIHVPDVDIKEPMGLIGNDQLYLEGSNGEVWLYDYARGGELKNLGLIATSRRIGEKISPYIESSFPLNGKKMIRASHKRD